MRFSSLLLPVAIAGMVVMSYRPLLAPADEWAGLLHNDVVTFHSHACLKQRISLDCLKWMIDGRAAAEFGVFEPLSWLLHSLLLTLNNGFLTFHSWRVVSVLLHALTSILVFFAAENLLERVDQPRPGLYRLPTFFATLFWATSPQRVEAVAWPSSFSVPWGSLWAAISLLAFVSSTSSTAGSSGQASKRFISWISFVAATWCTAHALPLVFVFLLIDLLVVLPEERALAAIAIKGKKNTIAAAAAAPNLILDTLRVSARGILFLFGWATSYFLTNLASLRAATTIGEPVLPTAELFAQHANRILDPITMMPRGLRALTAFAHYARQLVYPSNLHLFNTRHVPLLDESVERLLRPQHQAELVDVAAMALLVFILAVCITVSRQRVFSVCFGAFLLLLAPTSGLFARIDRPEHIFVADRWTYLASALLVPLMARLVVKDDAPEPEVEASAKSASINEPTKSPSKTKAKKADKAAATAALAVPVVASKTKKQAGYLWLAPRLILTLLLTSVFMFTAHLTPGELMHYKTIEGNCARVLSIDPDVVECHEILGIAHFRAGQYEVALTHLDRLLDGDLDSQSLVALVCRATILAGSTGTDGDKVTDDSPSAIRDHAESTRTFELALSIQPNSPYVLTSWARVQWAARNPTAAITTLERCIAHNSQYTPAFFLLAEIARAEKDDRTADTYQSQGEMIQANMAHIRATGSPIDGDSASSIKEGLTRATEAAGASK